MRLGSLQLKLLWLCGKGEYRSGDLAEMMCLGESRVSRMLDRLEDLGLVDATNRITDLGRKVFEP